MDLNLKINSFFRVVLLPIGFFILQSSIPSILANPINLGFNPHGSISEIYTYDEIESSTGIEVGRTGKLSRVLSEEEVRLDHEVLVQVTSIAARTGMSEVQLVTRAAQKAEVAIGGTGRFAGTAKHTYTNNLLSRYQSIYGNRGLQLNNYFNNGVGNRGFLDVVNHNSRTIYDFKFGSATWRAGQLQKYQRNFPGYNIQIIRP